jgi:hypothetical protein
VSDNEQARKVREVQDGLNALGDWLGERGLIRPGEGRIKRPPEQFALELWMWGVEAVHPADGKRLYAWHPYAPGTVMASRVREKDGRREHTTLDDEGMPGMWELSPVVAPNDPRAN